MIRIHQSLLRNDLHTSTRAQKPIVLEGGGEQKAPEAQFSCLPFFFSSILGSVTIQNKRKEEGKKGEECVLKLKKDARKDQKEQGKERADNSRASRLSHHG